MQTNNLKLDISSTSIRDLNHIYWPRVIIADGGINSWGSYLSLLDVEGTATTNKDIVTEV